MRLLHTITLIIVALHSTLGRCKRPRPNPVMGALQTILSPANAERTMQMLKIATQQTIGDTFGNCNPPYPPQIRYLPPIQPPEPCNMPLIPNQMPVQIPAPIPLQTPSPIQVQVPSPISYQLPSQPSLQLPTPPVQMQVQLPSPPIAMPVQPSAIPMQLPSPPIQLPCQVAQIPTPLAPIPEIILERPPCPYEREFIYSYPETPNYVYSPPAPVVPELIAPVALTSAQDIYTCPLPTPAALFTLPAASSCSCAQELTATRSQYLRKIPIPPPTL